MHACCWQLFISPPTYKYEPTTQSPVAEGLSPLIRCKWCATSSIILTVLWPGNKPKSIYVFLLQIFEDSAAVREYFSNLLTGLLPGNNKLCLNCFINLESWSRHLLPKKLKSFFLIIFSSKITIFYFDHSSGGTLLLYIPVVSSLKDL